MSSKKKEGDFPICSDNLEATSRNVHKLLEIQTVKKKSMLFAVAKNNIDVNNITLKDLNLHCTLRKNIRNWYNSAFETIRGISSITNPNIIFTRPGRPQKTYFNIFRALIGGDGYIEDPDYLFHPPYPLFLIYKKSDMTREQLENIVKQTPFLKNNNLYYDSVNETVIKTPEIYSLIARYDNLEDIPPQYINKVDSKKIEWKDYFAKNKELLNNIYTQLDSILSDIPLLLNTIQTRH